MARRRPSRRKGPSFRLSPPTNQVFLISLALIVLGIVGQVSNVPIISTYAFWIEAAGGVILLIACLLTGV